MNRGGQQGIVGNSGNRASQHRGAEGDESEDASKVSPHRSLSPLLISSQPIQINDPLREDAPSGYRRLTDRCLTKPLRWMVLPVHEFFSKIVQVVIRLLVARRLKILHKAWRR